MKTTRRGTPRHSWLVMPLTAAALGLAGCSSPFGAAPSTSAPAPADSTAVTEQGPPSTVAATPIDSASPSADASASASPSINSASPSGSPSTSAGPSTPGSPSASTSDEPLPFAIPSPDPRELARASFVDGAIETRSTRDQATARNYVVDVACIGSSNSLLKYRVLVDEDVETAGTVACTGSRVVITALVGVSSGQHRYTVVIEPSDGVNRAYARLLPE